MPRMYLVLPNEEHQALCDLALREWRDPREQATYMIAEGLKRAGVLSEDAETVTGSRDPEAA